MAYTFMVMSRDNTSSKARTFSMPKILFWICAIAILSAPVFVYFGTFHIVAPRILGDQMAVLTADYEQAIAEATTLRDQSAALKGKVSQLESVSDSSVQRRAEAEARTAILENSRAKTSSQMQTLEEEVYELRRAVEFYENLLKPATQKEVLQCFNIKATYTNKAKSLKYYVNFLKVEQKDKKRVTANVKYRILTGRSALNLDETEGAEVLHTQKLSMMKDVRLSGTIKKELPEDGLRILDVKAYDEAGLITAHCWKAF